ncbi:histidine kinase N-terminal 7TM domain-containing diguanylate cyclase [Oceaniglobus roseus]|uniref:histidine kinase N-terminal 7TM domain-containing diguanylate cyclase n=1 Tax=Oceaniglobus roseus TaxID=1737570 RepID=UPI001562D737|nr:histidine kinase N-terminal 7TM domain-containing protein [Kandeliimicrobium roseum]
MGLFIFALIAGIALMNLWLRKQPFFPGRKLFVACTYSMILWLLAVLAESLSPSLDCKVFWAYAAWPAIALLPSCWALFLRRYAYTIQRPLGPWELVFLVAGPLIITAMAFSNPWHGLFYGDATRLADIDGHAGAVFDHGPFFELAVGYLYVVMGAAIGVVIAGIRRSDRTHQSYFIFLLALSVMPLVANSFYVVFGFTIAGLDPTPFAFTAVLGMIVWLIYTERLFDIAAIAKDLLYYGSWNSVLVIGADGRIIGGNPRAKALLGLDATRIGMPVESLPHLSDFAGTARAFAEDRLPESLKIGHRHMSVQVTPILRPFDYGAAPMGFLIQLNDTTELRLANMKLQAALNLNEIRLKEISELRDDLERQLLVDPLTGVLNRRSIEATFTRLADATRIEKSSFVVAIIDIDHFKKINDNYGHAVGDRVLRDFARLLRARLDVEWPLFRVGGEEFVVFFPRCRMEWAAELLDRFRSDLQTDAFPRLRDPVSVTFSAGLVDVDGENPGFSEIYKKADERMYRAKMEGRGRTIYWDDVLPEFRSDLA